MKTNKRNRNLVLLLVLAIISLVALVATFARYTGEAGTASDTAQVAKWNVTMDNVDGIFKHEYSKNILATAGTDKIIAPGVDGSFEILLDNKGDVDASVSAITFSEGAGNAAVPMQYSVDGGTTWVSTIDDLNDAIATKVSSVILKAGQKQTVGNGITVQWKWAFDGNDTDDTVLGTASASADNRTTYTLDMTITATQIAPAK